MYGRISFLFLDVSFDFLRLLHILAMTIVSFGHRDDINY